MAEQKGLLIVLSGPSGSGKGTVCEKFTKINSNIHCSISATTRSPRVGEKDGVNYYFLKRELFEAMIAEGKLLEWAEVYGNYYGTPIGPVEETLARGKDVVLEIDVQGGLQVKEKFPTAVLIFLLPPSRDELIGRLKGRGTESLEEIEKRLQWVNTELQSFSRYDYLVINDRVEDAVAKIKAIITAEKCRSWRQVLNDKWQ